MTKEITRAIIIQEIEDKLKLREFEPEVFSFSERVVPIYDISQHLRKGIVAMQEVSVTATGGVPFFAVPATQKWFLHGYNVVFMGTGALTVSGLYILRAPHLTHFMYLDLTAGQTVSYTVVLPKTITLSPGDLIRINVDGYTSTQDLRLYIDYELEDVR